MVQIDHFNFENENIALCIDSPIVSLYLEFEFDRLLLITQSCQTVLPQKNDEY